MRPTDHISANNQKALEQAVPAGARLSLQELLAKPAYTGFVDAQVGDIQFTMLLVERDDGVALRWLWNHCYEPMTLALWASLAKNAKVIFDVGAHTGVYTLVAAKANGKASIVGFEPHGINFARLLTNLRANGLPTSNMFQCAVSDKAGIVPFTIPTENWYHSTGGRVGQNAGIVLPVQALTIDSFFAQNRSRIELMKIDVEGHEPNVLRSMPRVLSECHPDIILECIDAEGSETCGRILSGQGYYFYVIDDQNHTLTPTDSLHPFSIDGKPDMSRLSRLATCRPRHEVEVLQDDAQRILAARP
ncbi:MAG: FkbM family methyltransferase [Magnetospirillum sp.]|nr:FkbM family methyltransferase [Magnetospirillum sp.]